MPTIRKLIVVVDDDTFMLKGVARLLNASGFDTETYGSAEAFLARTERCEVTCLLLDIELGGMSGLELRRRLAASGDAVPVIFITALDDDATRQAAIEAGCIAYLQKPFSGQSLIGAINHVAA